MKKYFLYILGFIVLISAFSFIGVSANDDITSSSFEIQVGTVTPGGTSLISDDSGGETIQNFLGVVLEKLILVFGALSVFIMTVGAGYMIISHGQDDLLSRGKSIFMAGIIALVIALSAGIIVKIFSFLLYS